MFKLAQLDELDVLIAAPPSLALKLQPGQTASVEFAETPGIAWPAKVARSTRTIDPVAGTMEVELTLANPDYLLPAGLTGLATISAGPTEGTLQVPVNTVLIREGRSHVVRVVDGKAALTTVRLGRNFGAKVEVQTGLTKEDTVIVAPNALLKDGDAVATN